MWKRFLIEALRQGTDKTAELSKKQTEIRDNLHGEIKRNEQVLDEARKVKENEKHALIRYN